MKEGSTMKELCFMSNSESVIMKAIWDNTSDTQDISIPDLIDVLARNYGKEYARTTVVTFLLKLSDKRFLRTYRKGKLSFAHPIISIEEYRILIIKEQLDFWYNGDTSKMQEDINQTTKY